MTDASVASQMRYIWMFLVFLNNLVEYDAARSQACSLTTLEILIRFKGTVAPFCITPCEQVHSGHSGFASEGEELRFSLKLYSPSEVVQAETTHFNGCMRGLCKPDVIINQVQRARSEQLGKNA